MKHIVILFKKPLFCALFFLVAMFFIHPSDAKAQTTHAHSSSRQWKGIDINTVTSTHQKIYLYNVGTGRFAIDGGNWGMEARLFYEDFGRQMEIYIGNEQGVNGIRIKPGITENDPTKTQLICNIPGITKGSNWGDASAYSLTTIMDGYTKYGKWNFQRIPSEDSNSEYHTYYMWQQHSSANSSKYQNVAIGDIKFYLGAAYGEWCSDGRTTYNDGSTNDKGCGYYVHIDDDRSCWTTAGNANNNETEPWGNQTMVEVNGDQVPIDELYQWRIISEDEFRQVLDEEVVGLNPSVSSLVPDRDFTRNSDDFFNVWTVTPTNSTTPAAGEGRLGNTWGEFSKGKFQPKTNNTIYKYFAEAWDTPVKLKKTNNTIKEAKFGFMSFEGLGSVSVRFQVPRPGWYQVEGVGISFSNDPTHKAYMFAKADWVTVTPELRAAPNNSYLGYGQIELTNELTYANNDPYSAIKAKYPDVSFPTNGLKKDQNFNIAVGKVLTFHSEDYRRRFWIYIDPSQYNANDNNKYLTIGFQKDYALKSGKETKDGVDYYYDKDWICVDDIKVSYMGLAPAFFYENEESLDYLIYDANKIDERPSAVPDGMYSGALSLMRTLQKNKWNSFSFPIPLTGEQIRLAFGEDAKLAKIYGIGTLSKNSNVIDFVTVELKPTDPLTPVVEPGKFYLLKPTADPISGEDPFGRVTKYYQMGRNYFAVDPNQVPSGYSHTIIDTSNPYASQGTIRSYNDENDGSAYVSYVKTPGFATFSVSGGIYNGSTAPSGSYTPKGGYAVSNGNIVCVNKDTRIKGFRGWITTTNPIKRTQDGTAKIAVNGVVDGSDSSTDIDLQSVLPVTLPDNTSVYDLSGRKVGTLGKALPKGLYIVNGKKFLVSK